MILDRYLTRAELAKALKKSERTLLRWQSLQIGPPATTLGDGPVFDIEKVHTWLDSGGTQQKRRR